MLVNLWSNYLLEFRGELLYASPLMIVRAYEAVEQGVR